MKYNAFLPFSALIALAMISIFVHFKIVPPGADLLNEINDVFKDGFYGVIFLIILLEAIVYIGFYFPGQFFAVILVVGAKPTALDIVYLTLAMVLAATLGSLLNYELGKASTKHRSEEDQPPSWKQLLLAMIHINSLAFFMFSQGAKGRARKIVYLAGLLNLPYYLLLIAATSLLSEQVMAMAENTILLISLIGVWLCVAVYLDVKKYRQEHSEQYN
ncbi:hypothetical protein ACOI22_01395 [Glaciecola sp. 2405UD65-10]|uniref:hypothetical protein n=1 Tax=Glaciecola sp. 2405UD65-10 TaxID=3397244 RepID=UPI003B5BF324